MYFRRDATRVSLAYRYHNPQWDLAQNRTVYGEAHSIDGLGANMTIWLEVKGDLQPDSQLLIGEHDLRAMLARLKSLLDHRCLFEAEAWFQHRVPTLENIAIFLSEKIDHPWHSLTVQENENWRVKILSTSPEMLITYTWMDGFTKMEVTTKGQVDPVSGLAFSRERIKRLRQDLPERVLFRIEKPGKNATELRQSS
jgi:6-pyruvoyl-tetrahydropterin synthase